MLLTIFHGFINRRHMKKFHSVDDIILVSFKTILNNLCRLCRMSRRFERRSSVNCSGSSVARMVLQMPYLQCRTTWRIHGKVSIDVNYFLLVEKLCGCLHITCNDVDWPISYRFARLNCWFYLNHFFVNSPCLKLSSN